MKKWDYKVLGVMSGTSLDGIDLAVIDFRLTDKWDFHVLAAETIPYPTSWQQKLGNAIAMSDSEINELNRSYTAYLAEAILNFKKKHLQLCKNLDAVCSHGHTVKHEPKKGVSLQIGNLPELAEMLQETLVCDFRVQDVELGGQGAPLVPIGDELLFPEYDYCLNLGGFANISTRSNSERIAYDICPVNTVLNFYASKLNCDYDEGGKIAASGELNGVLLEKLNALPFYFQKPPKSLGMEWVKKEIFPVLEAFEDNIPSVLNTFCTHIALQVAKTVENNQKKSILVTGGGAFNDFLIQKIKENTKAEIYLPQPQIINYKEAIIFGLLGVLRLRNEVNVLKSVTGAVKDHSSGKIFPFRKIR